MYVLYESAHLPVNPTVDPVWLVCGPYNLQPTGNTIAKQCPPVLFACTVAKLLFMCAAHAAEKHARTSLVTLCGPYATRIRCKQP